MFSNGHRRFYRKNSFIPTENNKKPDTNEFTRLLLSIFDDMTKQLNGKHIFVPLSAGYDSRLVVSALKMCDYREVTCFYYGRDGSFEQSASKKIADRLGYDWIDVRLDDRFMKSFFSSDMFNKYVDYSDNGFSVPFVQDIAALSKMFESNQIDKDACVINGNSGDFISGGHIPSELKLETPEYVNFNTLSENIFNPFYEKHFKLWNKLGNDILKNKIRSTLETSLFEILNNNNVAAIDSSLKYELLEYYGRQSSYVVSAQRTYDFFGLDWKLPLWDTRIIDYFFSISPEYKYDQGFYKDTLINNNWCNVWHDIPLNKKTLYSYKIIIPRTLAKVMSAPFGKSNWHKVERRFFNYWLDDTRNSCENTYYAYLKNSFDARNRVSFQAEKYINNYKFSLDVVNKYKD